MLNVSNKKLELLDWILHLDDKSVLESLEYLKQNSLIHEKIAKEDQPEYGCLKGLIEISDDFDEPLEDFKDYM